MFTTLISPRFARIPANERKYLLSKYVQLLIGLIILSIGIVVIGWMFSNEVAWVLGKEYSNLQFEFVLNIVAACIGLTVGACHSMCVSRGWIVSPAISIPVTIGAIIIGLTIFHIDSLTGIILLNIFVGIIEVVIYITHSLLKIKQSITLRYESFT